MNSGVASIPPAAEDALKPVEDTLGQDWESLASYLHQHGLDHARDSPPRQFAGGLGNLNYLLKLGSEWVVLRRPPPGPLPPGANDMAREFRVLSGLAPSLPLVPRPIHFCADRSVLGQPFLIMEYRPGVVLGADIPARYRDRQDLGAQLGNQLVEFLADLHALDPDACGLGTLGNPEGFLDRAIEGWSKRAALAADNRPPCVVREIFEWLNRQRIPAQRPTLLHNDFKLDNMILDPDSLDAVAVIDWDMGSRGDPLFDLGTLVSYWVEPDDPPAMRKLRQMPTAEPGFMRREHVVESYARLTGRDVSGFRFYRVLAAFKLGVVFLQLHARFRQGETDDERFESFGGLGEELLEFAHDIAKGRAF